MSKKEALNEFLKILREKFKNRIKEVIVFGSYARGDYTEESDIDVLIVGDVSLDEIVDISVEILLKYGEVINAIVEKKEEFEAKKSFSFHKTVLKEGIRYYN